MGLDSVQQAEKDYEDEGHASGRSVLRLVQPDDKSASTPSIAQSAELYQRQLAARLAAANLKPKKRKKHESENHDLFQHLCTEASKLREAWKEDHKTISRAFIRSSLFQAANKFNAKSGYRWTAEREQKTASKVFAFCFKAKWVNRGIMRESIAGLTLREKQQAAAIRTAFVKEKIRGQRVEAAIQQFQCEGKKWTRADVARATGLSNRTVQRALKAIQPKDSH